MRHFLFGYVIDLSSGFSFSCCTENNKKKTLKENQIKDEIVGGGVERRQSVLSAVTRSLSEGLNLSLLSREVDAAAHGPTVGCRLLGLRTDNKQSVLGLNQQNERLSGSGSVTIHLKMG